MKSYRKELWFNAPERMHFTNITSEIRTCLDESGIQEGLVLIYLRLQMYPKQCRFPVQIIISCIHECQPVVAFIQSLRAFRQA